MKTGDAVRVHPHGHADQAAVGTVVMISGNERSIAVAFDEMPPFAFSKAAPLIAVSPEHGVVMLATRYDIGPWIELAGGGHYEIETLGDPS